MSILADTSGLLALLDEKSRYHRPALAYVNQLIIPAPVVTELDYLATKLLGAQVLNTFYESLLKGEMHFLAVDIIDVARAYEIMTVYADTPIGFVDASIVALAERYKVRQVLTLDMRHFAMFRPQGLGYLELLPTL